MARPKKILDEGEMLETSIEVPVEEPEVTPEPEEVLEVTEEPVKVEEVEELTPAKVFPYKVKLSSTGEMLTVVTEGVDANGRKLLTTDTGCTYHAE